MRDLTYTLLLLKANSHLNWRKSNENISPNVSIIRH